ncbi:MAG: hypothetical protein IPG92_14310 [Flavobacteriales bacterium]|nr:hypothetical protein [Flavobacteriales bacterium]
MLLGFSNKGHDGFLGNSVIGEWCNLGADTNNSNLKNTYGDVKVFSCGANDQVDTGLQFCGLIVGGPCQERYQYHVQYGDGGRCRCQCVRGGFPT